MRYNPKYIFWAMALCITALTACNKYLEITPKGYTLLTTVTHYDQWLNDYDALGLSHAPLSLNLLGDNVDQSAIPVPATDVNDLIYTWAPQYATDQSTLPTFWGQHYSVISKYNTVLAGIDEATGGTNQQKASLKAEALLGRAFEYWYLMNEYGPVYDPATADRDLAVPFVTSNDVAQATPPRSTVKEIYDRIISDINAALPNLPADNSSAPWRGSSAAAYSVLARIFFYSGDYTSAAKNAQLALDNGRATLLDFKTFNLYSYATVFLPDAIYWRGNGVFQEILPSFFSTYDPRDLRKQLWYFSQGDARGKTLFSPAFVARSFTYTNFGTSVQEMKLIIAEAAARKGELAIALQHVNDIRAARFPSPYQKLISSDQETVLNWVLRERAFEMPASGLRWFDMRRLDKEGKMPAVNRYDAENNIIATLPPHSPRYTLQIPQRVLLHNPGMPQNPWE
jgi:hypothetical protein